MVTQRASVIAILALVALPFALVAACDKVPLLAPTGSVITLIVSSANASLNSEVTIIATVIENGQASGGSGGSGGTGRPGAGTPVQNGTVITFTTTSGRIEPAEARTHNGQVTVKLITGSASGTATITAYSGGASAPPATVKIGTAAVKTVSVTTTPQSLGSAGGTTQVIATVLDETGSPLGGVPVTFSADKGSISPSTAQTDSSGAATATLTTTATAKVTATAGAASGSASVTVNVRSLTSFSASPTSASAGVIIAFTVNRATDANVSNVHVDFGDGGGTDLGAIGSGNTTFPHSFNSPGNYTATATAPGEVPLTTQVIIGTLQVTLSASPATPALNQPVTFTATLPGSPQIDHCTWTLDDGTGPFTTSSPQLGHTFTSRGIKNVRIDVFGVGGGKIGSATLTLEVP